MYHSCLHAIYRWCSRISSKFNISESVICKMWLKDFCSITFACIRIKCFCISVCIRTKHSCFFIFQLRIVYRNNIARLSLYGQMYPASKILSKVIQVNPRLWLGHRNWNSRFDYFYSRKCSLRNQSAHLFTYFAGICPVFVSIIRHIPSIFFKTCIISFPIINIIKYNRTIRYFP